MSAGALESKIIEKSGLLMEANRLLRMEHHWSARQHFLMAAKLEEEIAAELRAAGDPDWHINLLSAASSWVLGGETARACDNFVVVLRELPHVDINSDILWLLSNSTVREWLSAEEVLGVPSLKLLSHPLPPKAYTLAVGINSYADEGIPNLKFAENDAEAFADAVSRLESSVFSRERITTMLGRSATRSNLLLEIARLAAAASANDYVALFFAGHGATDRDGTRYLLPADARVNDLHATGLSMRELRHNLDEGSSKNVLIFFDSSFIGRNIERGLDFSEWRPRLMEVSQWTDIMRSGIAVLSACQTDQVSLESEALKHGIFTYFLLEGLHRMAGEEELRYPEILKLLRSAVPDYARAEFGAEQHPALDAVLTDAALPLFPYRQLSPLRLRLHLEGAVKELRSLLREPSSRETDIHEFFTRYPVFLTATGYDTVVSSPILKSGPSLSLIPDFILADRHAGRVSIVELKHPSSSSETLGKAMLQMKEYLAFFDQEGNRQAFFKRYGFSVESPDFVIVVGKSATARAEGIRFVTYDEILDRLAEASRSLEQ